MFCSHRDFWGILFVSGVKELFNTGNNVVAAECDVIGHPNKYKKRKVRTILYLRSEPFVEVRWKPFSIRVCGWMVI